MKRVPRHAVTYVAACCGLMLSSCSSGQLAATPSAARPSAVMPQSTGYRQLISFDGFFGGHPTGKLAQFNKLLVGTNAAGGKNAAGTIFRVNPDGKDPRLLASLDGGKDGCIPMGGGVFSGRGSSFYGTATSCGDATKGGTLYAEYAGGGKLNVVHAFDLPSDGGNPQGGLFATDTTLYGTTPNGGAQGKGTLYAVDVTSGVFTVLYAFGAAKDAAAPVAPLIEMNGKLYGTSTDGGSEGSGTVYDFDPSSKTEKVVHSFDGADGARPTAALLNWNGSLYGVTPKGGVSSAGVLFKIDPANGDETVLYNFGNGDAIEPDGSLVVYKDALYGITRRGGSIGKDFGTIFRYTPATKKYEELHAFAGKPDGAHPRGGLLFLFADRQDQLFGTTYDGGANDLGTAFSVGL